MRSALSWLFLICVPMQLQSDVTAVDVSQSDALPLLAILPPEPEDAHGQFREGSSSLSHLPLSIHVRVIDGVCEPLLRRGAALPVQMTTLLTTSRDNQVAARIELYAGERPFCDGNRFLGVLALSPLPIPSYRSFVQIELNVLVNSDGAIVCKAAEIENRALGEPFCEGTWEGDVLGAGGPPPTDNFETQVSLFSHAFTKHLPVLLATRSVRLPNGRDVIIKQHRRREEEKIGTGGVLWEAAIVLADYVGRNSSSFQWPGKRVLELGAGTGLVAIALALEGADVLATDGNPKVLEGTAANVDGARPFTGSVRTDVFDWNSVEDLHRIKSLGPWDFIVGSDLVYPGNAGRHCVASNETRPPADETLIALLAELSCAKTTTILALKDRTGEVARFQALAREPRLGWIISAAKSETIMPEFRSIPQVAVLHLSSTTN